MNSCGLRHCTMERDDDDVIWLTLDVADSWANLVTLDLIDDLHRALAAIEAQSPPAGLVMRSAKASGFALGGDAAELQRLCTPDYAARYTRRGQALTGRIAALPCPSVALLEGSCRGPGLELALACRYRLGGDDDAVVLCLPDVFLDLHASLGATVRLSERIGATPALNVMETGRAVERGDALEMGLLDGVHPADGIAEAARTLLREDPGVSRLSMPRRLLSSRPVWWLLDRIREADDLGDLAPEARTGADALRRLWREHGGAGPRRRYRAERQSFQRLMQQPAAHNRIRLYALTDRAMTEARQLQSSAPRHVHIVGAGDLGADLAVELAGRGRFVSVTEPAEGPRAALEARLAALPAPDGDAPQWRVDGDNVGIEGADLVIEAIPDDPEAKRLLMGELEECAAVDAVFASTTTTLPLSEIGRDLRHPERLIGLHPVREMNGVGIGPIIELAPAFDNAGPAVERGMALAAALERLPLTVTASPGYLILRMLLPYMLAGAALYSRAERELIDGGGRYLGMALGPLELADWIGLDVCMRLAEGLGYTVPDQLRERVELGTVGRRSGTGFHDWKGRRRVTASPPQGRGQFPEIGEALIGPLCQGAISCRDAAVVDDDDRIDMAAVLAGGLPGYTGGPLSWARLRAEEARAGETTVRG